MRGLWLLPGASLVGSALLAILLWQAVVSLAAPPSYILPGPYDVAETLITQRGQIWHHTWYTASEVLLGLLLGAGLGALSAIGLAASPLATALLRPMMVFSQAIPVFVLAPILHPLAGVWHLAQGDHGAADHLLFRSHRPFSTH